MASPTAQSGVLECGLPYAQVGEGGRPLVVFDSFRVEHRAAEGLVLQGMMGAYERYTEAGRTVYLLERPIEMPFDYSFTDMRDDYIAGLAEIAGVTGAGTVGEEAADAGSDAPAGAGLDLLGIGAGGLFALAAAAEIGRREGAPATVSRLAVVAAAARMSEEARAAAERWMAEAEELNWRTVHREMVSMSYVGSAGLFYGGLAWLFPELLGTTDYPWDFYITLREAAGADLFAELGSISVPTLLLGGAGDRLFHPADMEETVARIRSARLELLPGAGHAVTKSRRRAVERSVLRFFDDQ